MEKTDRRRGRMRKPTAKVAKEANVPTVAPYFGKNRSPNTSADAVP
jgi:hypothetical protein